MKINKVDTKRRITIIGEARSISRKDFIARCKNNEMLKCGFFDLQQLGVIFFYPDKKNDKNIVPANEKELFDALFALHLDPTLAARAFETVASQYFKLYNGQDIEVTGFNLAQLRQIKQPYFFTNNSSPIRIQALREFFNVLETRPVTNRKPDPPPGLDGCSTRRPIVCLSEKELAQLMATPPTNKYKQLEFPFPKK